ncbi:MAG TPA: hypothetical protein DCX95_01115 [Elusimicrobia bacterium]|nr:hypothetical protein [Elusimicrobiota bacterium]
MTKERQWEDITRQWWDDRLRKDGGRSLDEMAVYFAYHWRRIHNKGLLPSQIMRMIGMNDIKAFNLAMTHLIASGFIE